MTTTLQVGERVMGGTTAEDFDVGTIRSFIVNERGVETGEALVMWESGVTTLALVADLAPYDADHARQMRAALTV